MPRMLPVIEISGLRRLRLRSRPKVASRGPEEISPVAAPAAGVAVAGGSWPPAAARAAARRAASSSGSSAGPVGCSRSGAWPVSAAVSVGVSAPCRASSSAIRASSAAISGLVGALQRVDLGAQGGDGILGRGGGSGVGGRSGAPLCGRGGVAAAEGEAERQRGGEEGTARRARGPVGAKAGCRGRRAPVGEALTAFARDVVARDRSVHRVGSPFRIVAIGALVPARLAPCRTTLRGRS